MINNQTFIRQVAKATGYTIADVETVIKAIPQVIADNAKQGEDTKAFTGITFKTKVREAHECRDPRTGEPVSVPAKRQLATTFSTTYKDALND